MKKKIAAYSVTAIVLGFVIMMVPLALEARRLSNAQPQSDFFGFMKNPLEMISKEDADLSRTYGLGSQPLSLLPSSLIFFSGLIIALGVYAILKRRMI